jgi:predicted transposase YbfD/YdcC
MSKPIRMPQADEQVVLEELQIELVRQEQLPRFQSLLRRHHYFLGGIKPVGERLYYVATWHGQWLALLVFCAAAKHLRHRERWIGWTEGQRRKRLGLVTNNARFLVLPQCRYPNLATRVMGLCLGRLPQDWQARYGHPVWLAESFVDRQLFRGTAYKASGWTELGATRGYGRCQQDYYVKHDRPKALFIKELKQSARRSLCADHLPAALAAVVESKVAPLPAMRAGELRSLRDHFASVPDFRGRVESYPLSGALAMVACAHLCGAPRGHRDLKAFARRFTQAQLRALGVRPDPKTGRYPSPSKATFGRVLRAVDPLRVEAALLDWQKQVRGPSPPGQLLAADGKELRHAQGAQVVTLTHPASQYYRVSQWVETKSNEIPAMRQLLGRVEVAGSLIGIDALHTQQETARQIVQEAGADYLLTVKANQKELRQTLARRLPKPEQLFSPLQSRCRRSGPTRANRRIGAAKKSAPFAQRSSTRNKPLSREQPRARSFCGGAWAISPTLSTC